jgi:ribose 5-phosphate isomerase A
MGPDGAAMLTDGGNFIVDCGFGAIADAASLDTQLRALVGVVETGLFIGRAEMALVAGAEGVTRFLPRGG